MRRHESFISVTVLLFVTAFATSARADAIAILQPTAEYTGATCLIPITASGGLTFLEGCGETIFFSSLVASESPGPFGWGGPPDTEGGDPTVLRHLFFRDSLSFTLTEPMSILGFEVGSNRILGDPIEVTFFDTFGQAHGSVVRTVEAGHALLFAAQSTDLRFTGASIRSGVGDSFSIARIRVGRTAVPEPSMLALGVVAVMGRCFWRSVRSTPT
jgi:hypothetical protein